MTRDEAVDHLAGLDALKLGDYELQLVPDNDPEDPLDSDCGAATFVCFHSRYSLGSNHSYRPDDFCSWEHLRKHGIERDNNVWLIKPLYMYDHGGITIRTSPFSCQFDSGQIGWVYYTAEQVKAIQGWSRKSESRLKLLDKMLESDVEMYDQYLRGDVYQYEIRDSDGEVTESCGGYYDLRDAAFDCLNCIPEDLLKD